MSHGNNDILIDDEEALVLTRLQSKPIPKDLPERFSSFSSSTCISLVDELWASTDVIFQHKTTLLLILGPIAVVGDYTGILRPAMCFALSGIALIPLAERLSFVTEQVAEHTNGTIGALLNATFGNAPELLISVSALKSGYYRVVQLAMLGSMVTNMILVFGVSCLIGGLRWQVQEVRQTSGNANVVMLLLATAGSLFPSALVMTGQLPGGYQADYGIPSQEEVTFSRVNAAVMLILYLLYLVFQLGTHKEEFDDEPAARAVARRNIFCQRYKNRARRLFLKESLQQEGERVSQGRRHLKSHSIELSDMGSVEEDIIASYHDEGGELLVGGTSRRSGSLSRRNHELPNVGSISPIAPKTPPPTLHLHEKRKVSDNKPSTPQHAHHNKAKSSLEPTSDEEDDDDIDPLDSLRRVPSSLNQPEALISLRVGIMWLFLITLCISAITDVLVGTIDGFATRMNLSEVFTSMVIIPYFSNVAEQVSAFIFAYRNEMDLCVGVTVGSAIQIATFVLPGSVLIGWAMDRSMTLFFRGFETVSLFFGVVVVSAILQGGTTNWLVGAILVGVYIIFASGIWFHEVEELTVDAQTLINNATTVPH